MSRLAWFLVAAMAASLPAAPAYAGSGAGAADADEDRPAVIATGDFNRDGIADVVEVTSQKGDDSGRSFLTVLLGQKDGSFRSASSHSLGGDEPSALVVGDFNGDGNLDVIVGDSDGTLVEFLGDGTGNLVEKGNIAALGSVASMATGHFTRDGHLDLVVSDFRSNSAIVLLGAGNGSFERASSFALPRIGHRFHIATADFSKDGIDDLLIASDDEDDEDYEVMLGNGNGTFSYSPELSHVRDPRSYCPS